MKVITKAAAEKEIDTDKVFAEVIESWLSDYECNTAKLIAATELSHTGKLKKSNTRWVLTLDNEPVEIEYSFYLYPEGNIEFEPTHWHD